jgi:hypothetical protein
VFGAASVVLVEASARTTTDLDCDGFPDLIAILAQQATFSGVVFAYDDHFGQFAQQVRVSDDSADHIVFEDFNGDGLRDLLYLSAHDVFAEQMYLAFGQ